MTKSLETKYKEAVYRALERFQFIEETMRMYLELVIQISKIELKGTIPVNISTKELSKLPLGKLSKLFSVFNDNKSILKNLKDVTPKRNHVAHQSLLFTIGELEDTQHIEKCIEDMAIIESQAKAIHESLLDERWKLHKSLNALRRSRKQQAK